MYKKTLDRLRCPVPSEDSGEPCASTLNLSVGSESGRDVRSGILSCGSCGARFPILEGVAILVADVEGYLHAHAKGISHWVPAERIPAEFQEIVQAGLEESLELHGEEHQEEDLEAERVTSLYVMTHFLKGRTATGAGEAWWKPAQGEFSPFMEELIQKYWDQGPFARIQELLTRKVQNRFSLIELGCGVGGLSIALEPSLSAYLGVDSSFASIALARHLVLGAPSHGEVRIPGDLLAGPVSRPLPHGSHHGRHSLGDAIDFIVTDAVAPAVAQRQWDVCASLNMIDMLEEPESLPRVQHSLIRTGGVAVQSCPYIWHPRIARELRARLNDESLSDSAQAVERLYRDQGFEIMESVAHVPWLFFKHFRQMEIYSVHLFAARAGVQGV